MAYRGRSLGIAKHRLEQQVSHPGQSKSSCEHLKSGDARYKAEVSNSRRRPTPRPAVPSPPSSGFAALAGKYENLGYGSIELCRVPPTLPSSNACWLLAATVHITLPGAINPDIPTFIAKWDKTWSSHIKFAHFDGNIFNVSLLYSLVSLLCYHCLSSRHVSSPS